MSTKILLKSKSPLCELEAYVEEDQFTTYFTIYGYKGNQKLYLPVFVCNTTENYIDINEWIKYEDTAGPMEHYNNIQHSKQGMKLDSSKLEIVWTCEGSSAGLYYKDELIAYIPEWSTQEFPGYSKYVIGESIYALPLEPASKNIEDKLEDAKGFWLIADDYWKDFQESNVKAIESFTNEIKSYWGIDGNRWPAKGLALTEDKLYSYSFTIGVSALRQPMSESIFKDNYKDNTRIELGMICEKQYEDKLIKFIPSISGMTTIPWSNITPLAHGHTVLYEFDEEFVGVWLISGNKINFTPKYEKFCGDTINLLWIVPVTKDEYEYLIQCNVDQLSNIEVPDDLIYFNNESKDIINILKNNKIYK